MMYANDKKLLRFAMRFSHAPLLFRPRSRSISCEKRIAKIGKPLDILTRNFLSRRSPTHSLTWMNKPHPPINFIIVRAMRKSILNVCWVQEWVYQGRARNWFLAIVTPGRKGVAKSHREATFILSLIHIWRCRRYSLCRSRWSPYH